MPETASPTFPDILGYITGGKRHNINVAQVALAVRPRVVRAGRPFEAILLIQNASDVNVDVTATLQLPETDAKRKPKRFLTKSERLVVGLRPAEVGYVALPLSCLPDTAVGDGYKVGMTVEVKPLGKPKRVRAAEGGGEVVMEDLSDETVARLNDLKKLQFSAQKRGIMATTIEAGFAVMSAQIAHIIDFKPDWVSLWKISDHRDDGLLVERYGDGLQLQVLPLLKRELVLQPLHDETLRRFEQAGYPLQNAEAHYIAKLMTVILEMANPRDETVDPLADPLYNVALTLKKHAEGEKLPLPSWCKAMLRGLDRQPGTQPLDLLTTTIYDDLLRDAIRAGFHCVTQTTGEALGSESEMTSYGERVIGDLTGSGVRSFTDVYLPLVLGGVIFYDRALADDEQVGEALKGIAAALRARQSEVNEDNEVIFQMAVKIIDQTIFKYGYRA